MKKKNILLMTSGAPSHSPLFTTEKRFPLGVGFLISVLRRSGHNVLFIDNYLAPSAAIINGFLQKNQIDYLGIYSNTICYQDTLRIIQEAAEQRKNFGWNGKIMVGGPHASLFPDSFTSEADYVVKGEGEITILDIVEERIAPGIYTGKIVEDLDSLPMTAYDYFQDERYWKRVPPSEITPVYTMNTSRGCPFSCRFCSVKGVWGKTYRFFSAERIVEDIELLIQAYGVKGIYFREDHFTLNKKRVYDFCKLIQEKKIDIKWFCESRITDINHDLLLEMKKSGCEWIYFGCESGSQRVLDHMKKGITVERIREVIRLCHEVGVKSHTSWVIGVPTETEQELQMTLDLIDEIKPTSAGKNVFIGLPGSEYYEDLIHSDEFLGMDELRLAYSKKYNDLVKRFYGKAASVCLFNPKGKDNAEKI